VAIYYLLARGWVGLGDGEVEDGGMGGFKVAAVEAETEAEAVEEEAQTRQQ